MPQFLSCRDISNDLRVNERTTRRWMSDGELPTVRIGNQVRVRTVDYEAFLDRKMAEAV